MIERADVMRTLQREAGIARSAVLHRPDSDRNPLWTLAIDIGQTEFVGRRRTGDDYSLALVGAADVNRADVFDRAAGEAVERWALKPSAIDRPRNGRVTAPRGATWAHLGSAHCPVYPGTLRTGTGSERVWVPAGAVDYPAAADPGDRFDPGPSGAAAGAGVDDAIDRACRELLERDAAMRAWLSEEPVVAVDIDSIGSDARQFGQLTEICRRLGLDSAVAYLPSPYENVRPVMAMVVDRARGVASAGLALDRCDSHAAARALQEALQVRTVLTARASADRQDPPDAIENDGDRARFWSSPAGVAAGIEWTRRVQPNNVRLSVGGNDVRWRDVIGVYTVVDLTPRLPARVREMGWAVVKAFAPGLQPLRMSDILPWSVLGEIDVRAAVPHPFI